MTYESNAENLAGDIAEAYEVTTILWIFDNAPYKGEVGGTLSGPIKINGRYHFIGKLVMPDGQCVKELFVEIIVLFSARE